MSGGSQPSNLPIMGGQGPMSTGALLPLATQASQGAAPYSNSGLLRFTGAPSFQMPSYTPAQFQAPQLAPYRGPIMGSGGGGQAAPSADIGSPGGGVGEGGGYGSGDGGYGDTQGSTGNFGDSVSAVANSNLGDAIAAFGPTAGGLLGGPIGATVAGMAVGPSSNFGMQNAISNMYGTQNVNFDVPFADEGSYGPGPGPESATNVSSIGAINGMDAMSDAFGGGAGGFGGGPGAGQGGTVGGPGAMGDTSGYGGGYGSDSNSGDGSGGGGGK